jgi:hypothetical protein
MDRFAKVPVAVLSDSRLGKNELKVLISLFLFAGKTGKCFPKRETISQLTSIPVGKISTITTRLSALGWIEKQGNGGRSSPAHYLIRQPETLPKTVTVTESVTVTETVTKTLPKTVTRKEKTIEKTKRKEKVNQKERTPIRKANGHDLSNLPNGITQEAAQGFIDHRKLMKAPLTQRAFVLAMQTAAKAAEIGLTPDQAIDETVAAGWKGINLDWLQNRLSKQTKSNGQRYEKPLSQSEINNRFTDELFGRSAGQYPESCLRPALDWSAEDSGPDQGEVIDMGAYVRLAKPKS